MGRRTSASILENVVTLPGYAVEALVKARSDAEEAFELAHPDTSKCWNERFSIGGWASPKDVCGFVGLGKDKVVGYVLKKDKAKIFIVMEDDCLEWDEDILYLTSPKKEDVQTFLRDMGWKLQIAKQKAVAQTG